MSVCKETGWDKACIKTLEDVCDVGRSTVQRWKNKYPARPRKEIFPNLTDEEIKVRLLRILQSLYDGRGIIKKD